MFSTQTLKITPRDGYSGRLNSLCMLSSPLSSNSVSFLRVWFQVYFKFHSHQNHQNPHRAQNHSNPRPNHRRHNLRWRTCSSSSVPKLTVVVIWYGMVWRTQIDPHAAYWNWPSCGMVWYQGVLTLTHCRTQHHGTTAYSNWPRALPCFLPLPNNQQVILAVFSWILYLYFCICICVFSCPEQPTRWSCPLVGLSVHYH